MITLFDLNGTLTDPAGIGEPWGAPELGSKALRGAVETAMVDALTGEYRPFSEHIRSALELIVARRGLEPSGIERALERAAALDPFPDAAEALDRLKAAGYQLAVLTNSGADSGRKTLEAAGLVDRFAHILGVDAVKSFKPHPRTYAHALAELDAEPGQVTMVAAHAWDVTGAKHAGLRTAWIARNEGSFPATGLAPDVEASDLLDVARKISQSAP
ncbi:MAG TPA: haloacid dehalogenase type II [Thermoleophilaceae bacterium]|nr:haloacid dehalogenase type II [Thermoleophilaceae bacterium]